MEAEVEAEVDAEILAQVFGEIFDRPGSTEPGSTEPEKRILKFLGAIAAKILFDASGDESDKQRTVTNDEPDE